MSSRSEILSLKDDGRWAATLWSYTHTWWTRERGLESLTIHYWYPS